MRSFTAGMAGSDDENIVKRLEGPHKIELWAVLVSVEFTQFFQLVAIHLRLALLFNRGHFDSNLIQEAYSVYVLP
jgi:hypothetical protein